MLPTTVWKVVGRVQEPGIKRCPISKCTWYTFAMQYEIYVHENIKAVRIFCKENSII